MSDEDYMLFPTNAFNALTEAMQADTEVLREEDRRAADGSGLFPEFLVCSLNIGWFSYRDF